MDRILTLWHKSNNKDNDQRPDSELLRAVRDEADKSAATTLLWRYSITVMAICLRRARNPQDADDAFQALWLKVLASPDLFLAVPFMTAADRCVRNLTFIQNRSASRRKFRESRAGGTTADEPADADQAQLVLVAVEGLPAKYKAVVRERYLNGESRERTAEKLEISVEATRYRETQAIAKLAKKLRPFGVAVAVLTALSTTRRLLAATAHRLIEHTLGHLRNPTGVPVSEAVRELVRSAPAVLLAKGLAGGVGVTLALTGLVLIVVGGAHIGSTPATANVSLPVPSTQSVYRSAPEVPPPKLPPRRPSTDIPPERLAKSWQVSQLLAPDRFVLVRNTAGKFEELTVTLANVTPAGDQAQNAADLEALVDWIQEDYVLLPEDFQRKKGGKTTPVVLKRASDELNVNTAIVDAGRATRTKPQ